jgi:hypothetical protein
VFSYILFFFYFTNCYLQTIYEYIHHLPPPTTTNAHTRRAIEEATTRYVPGRKYKLRCQMEMEMGRGSGLRPETRRVSRLFFFLLFFFLFSHYTNDIHLCLPDLDCTYNPQDKRTHPRYIREPVGRSYTTTDPVTPPSLKRGSGACTVDLNSN